MGWKAIAWSLCESEEEEGKAITRQKRFRWMENRAACSKTEHQWKLEGGKKTLRAGDNPVWPGLAFSEKGRVPVSLEWLLDRAVDTLCYCVLKESWPLHFSSWVCFLTWNMSVLTPGFLTLRNCCEVQTWSVWKHFKTQLKERKVGTMSLKKRFEAKRGCHWMG